MSIQQYPSTQGIYKIINTTSNKFYIGSSKQLNKRIIDHFSRLRNNIHKNKFLQRAFNKYGESSFKIEILEEFVGLTPEELLAKEQHHLDLIENWRDCYNQTRSTKYFGKILPEEYERKQNKIASVTGENNPFYGKTHSKQSVDFIVEANRKRGGSAYRKTNSNRWETTIKVNKKSIYLGSYETKEEACYIRVLAEKFYWDKDSSVKEELDKAQLNSPKKARKLPSGVYKKGKYDKYEARLIINKQSQYLGSFNTPEEAHLARLEALQSLLS
jgi:group I intron endonuclease